MNRYIEQSKLYQGKKKRPTYAQGDLAQCEAFPETQGSIMTMSMWH